MGLCLDTDKKYEDNGEEIRKHQKSKLLNNDEEDLTSDPLAQELEIEDDVDFKTISQDGDDYQKFKKKVNLQEFEFLRVVGRGSFGKVMLVSHKFGGQLYAMKILRKDAVEKRNQKTHTKHERQILESVRHPFIVQLYYAFQTPSKLYLITDFLIGGELFFHLRRSFKFTEERAKFYTAELVSALDYLHRKGIIYRDLKPENILIGQDGHIKITDFGLSKVNMQEGEKTNTFCGTPEYLAPEILLGKGHDKSVDWWSLGALLYEMLSGAPPFYSKDKTLMFKNRLEKPIEMKSWFSQNAISLLQALLCNDPKYRMGFLGASEIRQHPFFDDIDWDLLERKQIDPPFKPKLTSNRDLRHFDPLFTDEPVSDTPVMQDYLKEDQYEKFTYQKANDSVMNDRLSASMKRESQFVEINQNFKLPNTNKHVGSVK